MAGRRLKLNDVAARLTSLAQNVATESEALAESLGDTSAEEASPINDAHPLDD